MFLKIYLKIIFFQSIKINIFLFKKINLSSLILLIFYRRIANALKTQFIRLLKFYYQIISKLFK